MSVEIVMYLHVKMSLTPKSINFQGQNGLKNDKNAQQNERVIIQLQHITDTAYSLAQLKGRQKKYQKEQGLDDYLVKGDFEEEKRKSESSTTLGEDS